MTKTKTKAKTGRRTKASVSQVSNKNLTTGDYLTAWTNGVHIPNEKNMTLSPLKAGVVIMTTKDIVARCKKGVIKGYKNNRGKGKIIHATIDKVANNFVPHSIGIITLSEDGTIVDAHNRVGGLCLRARLGKMTDNDWDSPIPVRVVTVTQFMETYKHLGDVEGHSIADHLSNPDLLIGSCLIGENGVASCLNKMGYGSIEQSMFKAANVLTVLGNITTALHMQNSNIIPEAIGEFNTFADVYKVRHHMKNMARALNNQPIALIRPTDYEKIAEGCVYYENFRKALRDQKAKDEFLPPIKGLTGSKGLMGLIIADVVFNEKAKRILTKNSARTLAQRLLHRANKVESILADILGSNNKNASKAIKKVVKIASRPIEVQ